VLKRSVIAGTGFLFLSALSLSAAPPKIDYLEMFLKTNVLIHFDTEPNRIYTLQYTETLPTYGSSPAGWTNLYVAPSIPFPNHYIVPDTAMRRQRFYRLMASP
jgi:hypothetical protein